MGGDRPAWAPSWNNDDLILYWSVNSAKRIKHRNMIMIWRRTRWDTGLHHWADAYHKKKKNNHHLRRKIRIQRHHLFSFRIDTLALFAVILVELSALNCFSAAVTTVITTATIVVCIVADAVAFVLRRATLLSTFAVPSGGFFVFWIEALALEEWWCWLGAESTT